MLLLPPLLALLACGQMGQDSDAKAYAAAMQRLFDENNAISREFLDVAVLVKKQDLAAHEIAARFSERVVPRATALAQKVDAIDPGSSGLEQVHSGIERAWAIRAESYSFIWQP